MLDNFTFPHIWQKRTRHPATILYQNTAQSIANNTNTALVWDTEQENTGRSLWDSGDPTKIILPPYYNLIRITYVPIFTSTFTGGRRGWVEQNGSMVCGGYNYYGNETAVQVFSRWLPYKPGDILIAYVWHNQGGPLNTAGSGTFGGPIKLTVEFDNA